MIKRQDITYYLQDRNGNRRSALLLLQIPTVERIALETAEKLLLDVGIAPLQLMDQILHLLSAGGAVGRAGVVDHRQAEPFHRAADVILPAVQQWADLGRRTVPAVSANISSKYFTILIFEQFIIGVN